MKNRSEIAENFKWDLSPLCESEEEALEILEKSKKYLPKLKKFEGKLNNKENILQFFKLEKEFSHLCYPAYFYVILKNDEDLSNSNI